MMDSNQKRDLANRLKSIEGHIRGIERMLEEDAYCMDILKQVKAVQQALERVSALTLENHLHTCVTTAIRSEDSQEQERVIHEIMDVFKATNVVTRLLQMVLKGTSQLVVRGRLGHLRQRHHELRFSAVKVGDLVLE